MKIQSIAITLLLSSGLVQADAEPNSEALLNANCMKCHGTEVYTRTDRRIGSLPSLEAQVRRCDTNLGTKWFDEEILGVTHYLNKEYYHFEAKE